MTLENHIPHISKHYCHAINKHPHFADKAFCKETLDNCQEKLSICRSIWEQEEKVKNVYGEDLLLCELWEVAEAIKIGDNAAAIEELYDTIAVLMRMVDFIEKENHNDHQS